MPSHTHYSGDSDMHRDQQSERDNYYVSHNTSTTNNNHQDHLPEGTLSIRTLNGSPVSLFGLCLFDSGSTSTLINERAVPPTVKPKQGDSQLVTTTQGTYASKNYFDASEIMFPEFCKTRMIPKVHLRTFSSATSRYDFIVGRDILKFGFILDHAHARIVWDGLSIPMTVQESAALPAHVTTHFSCARTFRDNYATGSKKIKQAKYDSVSPTVVAAQCSHLSPQQQKQLETLLQQFPQLFSGQLGRYNKNKFTLELLNPATVPIFCKPYPIAQTHMQVFLQELQHLIDKGVLEHVPRSEWAFPTFIIPKKDGRVRWVSDFRKLNKLLKRPRYFLPSIPEIMQRRQGFTFITKIDIAMGFYTFEIDLASQKLCVISTLYGLYKYKRLPMGITNSPDFFQSVMHPLFADLPDVECFIDD